MNFYKHFIGDYARDTAHLSMIEHGAYRSLLDTYYATAKPLPAGKADLYRISKAFRPAERRAIDSVADQFFPINGDGFRHNKRADEEIKKEKEYLQSQRDRANRRWGNEVPAHMPPHAKNTMPADMPPHMPELYPNDATTATATVNQDQKLCRFPEFWAIYPKGSPRKPAETKWKQKRLDQVADKILDDIRWRLQHDSRWRDGFVQNGATYLHQERWNEERISTQPQARRAVV